VHNHAQFASPRLLRKEPNNSSYPPADKRVTSVSVDLRQPLPKSPCYPRLGYSCLPLLKVAQLSQLPAGSVTEVIVDETPYAICNVAGRVTALAGTCPHRGGPLGQGAIHGNYVVCPWHAWQWDCATGANDFDPTKQVPTFKVEVAGDDILIEIP
jgi:nitrite reductase (NADH) small subunit